MDGPTVLGVQRAGGLAASGQLILTFDKPLDAGSVQDLGNYRLADVQGRSVAVTGAAYDPATNAVSLAASKPLDPRQAYRLTVIGTSPTGVADASGKLLDGAGVGQPGGNFVVVSR